MLVRMEFWLKIFDTSDFPPRWNCGKWTPGHGWLHILSDIGVWSAYFAIPCVLLYFLWRRKDLPFRLIFLLFGAFILLCGSTHLMEAVIFWWPAYRLAGVIKLLTAVVSWITVVALMGIAPRVLVLRSPEELEREVAQRTAELAATNNRLAAEREWFRTTLASIGDGVITTDTHGRVTMLNPVAERLTGWKSQEAQEQPLSSVFRIVNEETRLPVEDPALRALHEGTIVGLANHTILIAKDGTESFIDDSAAPIRDVSGEIVGAVLVFKDVGDRREAAQRLQASEERFRLAVEATGVGIFDYDPASDEHLFSEQALEILDFAPGTETSGKAVFNAVHPDDRERVRAAFETCLDPNGDGVLSVEHRLVRPDKTVRWVTAKAQTVFSVDGRRRAVRTVGTILDTTERKRMETELHRYAADLAEADRRKDKFLATLAHELRNPLAPIRTGLEVMKLAKDDPTTIQETRDILERQTHQLIKLVDDLLDVSRISRGKLELRKCRVKLADVLTSAVEASTPFIQEAGHELTVHVPQQPIFLDADPNRLAQVVSNLLNNSAKYTPKGGQVTLVAERLEGDVLIRVQDNGIGIPPEMQPRIFEMFAQIDRPMEKGYTGLGIGLTLVKWLVDLHGGSIEVSSEVNQGSEFRVRLPVLVEMPTDELQSPESQESGRQLQRKVLVVDDNLSAAMLLSMVVKMLGCEVRTAADGEEAVQVAADFLPDAVFMDIGMPKMNGYEAASHIRQQPWGEKMMLVALTGWGQDEDRRRTTEAGFDFHLVKPAEPSELQKVLATIEDSSPAS